MMNEIVSKLCVWLMDLGSHIVHQSDFPGKKETNVSMLYNFPCVCIA